MTDDDHPLPSGGLTMSDDISAAELEEWMTHDNPLEDVIPGEDLRLADVSLTYVDENGTRHTHSVQAIDYDEEEEEDTTKAPHSAERIEDALEVLDWAVNHANLYLGDEVKRTNVNEAQGVLVEFYEGRYGPIDE